MNSLLNNKVIVLYIIAAVACLAACGGEEAEENHENKVTKQPEILDSNQAMHITVDGEIFSIPSPIQTAILLKEAGASYNEKLVNDASKAKDYATKFKKATNLGLYGADLGYLTIYDNTNAAVEYLKAVENLSNDLGVAGAFDKTLMERFSSNLGNQDSMLVLVSEAYRSGDNYLKSSDRAEVAALILAGGWIEALHFAVDVAREKKDKKVIDRIGQQKSSLESLIGLLNTRRDSEEYQELVDALKELQVHFDKLEYTYNFEDPEIIPEKHLTKIKSGTEVKVSEEELNAIAEKIASIRNIIVG